jgi:hypothetical protein
MQDMHEDYAKKQFEQCDESVSVAGRGDPYGWEASGLPYFIDNRPRNGGEGV